MKKMIVSAILLAFSVFVTPIFGATNFVSTSIAGPLGITLSVSNLNGATLTNSWELQRSTNGESFVGVSSTNTFAFGSPDGKTVGRVVPWAAFIPGQYRFVAMQSGTNLHTATTNLLFTAQTVFSQSEIRVSVAGIASYGFVVESSTNLINWSFHSSNAPGVATLAIDSLTNQVRKFYRIKTTFPQQ
ncbi:MAG: hypothetical protein AAB447_00090 [Patescibacteria group bacterium]